MFNMLTYDQKLFLTLTNHFYVRIGIKFIIGPFCKRMFIEYFLVNKLLYYYISFFFFLKRDNVSDSCNNSD